jgi:hypothetical protein
MADDIMRGGKDAGYWGRGVIGEEQYKKEQEAVAEGSSVFGPGVLGLRADAVNKAGPGVTDQAPEATESTADAAKSTEAPSLSIKELEAALEENPALVDTLLTAELARPGGPRKGALEALEVAESLGRNREDVLTQIAAALGAEDKE